MGVEVRKRGVTLTDEIRCAIEALFPIFRVMHKFSHDDVV